MTNLTLVVNNQKIEVKDVATVVENTNMFTSGQVRAILSKEREKGVRQGCALIIDIVNDLRKHAMALNEAGMSALDTAIEITVLIDDCSLPIEFKQGLRKALGFPEYNYHPENIS